MLLLEICWSGPQTHLRSVSAYLFFVRQYEGRPHLAWIGVDNLGEIWSSQTYFWDGILFLYFWSFSDTHYFWYAHILQSGTLWDSVSQNLMRNSKILWTCDIYLLRPNRQIWGLHPLHRCEK